MMIGHALLAFALVAVVAGRLGWPDERALVAGVVAGAFATLPDVDMVNAFLGATLALAGGTIEPFALVDAFWSGSMAAHRTVTHSLVIALPAGLAFGLWAHRGEHSLLARVGALVLGAGIVAVTATVDGQLAGAVATCFVGVGLAISWLASRWTDLSTQTIGGLALVGLLTHPWGDLFTGEVPTLFYPLDVTPLASILRFHPDPTLNLLSAFALELAVVAFAAVVLCRHTDRSLRDYVDRPAALGAGYAVAVVVLPPPTLDVSYHFVFSILAVGGICATPTAFGRWWSSPDRDDALTVVLTGVAAVAVALVSYATLYAIA